MSNSDIAIIIPTINHSELLIRALAYYANVGCRHTIYVGDSSDPGQLEQSIKAIERLQNRVNILHIPLPGLNETEAMSDLIATVHEPYSVFVGDDDFMVPESLDKCALFLDAHSDFSLAYGLVASFTLEPRTSGGVTAASIRYPGWRSIEHSRGSERLLDYLSDVFPNLYAVRRTMEFRASMDASLPLKSANFRELLTGSLSIVRGKGKVLDCLYLARQDHDRYPLRWPDIFDTVTTQQWQPSHPIFFDRLQQALAQEDQITISEAGEIVKQAHWSYLVNRLTKGWESLYAPHGTGLRAGARLAAGRIPLARETWRQLRSLRNVKRHEIKMGSLLRRSSPYHIDFMPVYRAAAAPSEQLIEILTQDPQFG